MAARTVENRVALVTGGNRGIGLEVCRQLAKEGARVILGARDLDSGERAAEELRSKDGNLQITVERIDVASMDSIAELHARLKDSIDILVNNAGILDRGSFRKVQNQEVSETLDTNLRGPMLLAQVFSAGMIRRG